MLAGRLRDTQRGREHRGRRRGEECEDGEEVRDEEKSVKMGNKVRCKKVNVKSQKTLPQLSFLYFYFIFTFI